MLLLTPYLQTSSLPFFFLPSSLMALRLPCLGSDQQSPGQVLPTAGFRVKLRAFLPGHPVHTSPMSQSPELFALRFTHLSGPQLCVRCQKAWFANL